MSKPRKSFYELDVQSNLSSGESEVKQIVERADYLGFKGLAISDYAADKKDINKLKDKISEIDSELDVHVGAKIKAGNTKVLKEKISTFRNEVDVLIVHGGSVEINRAACEDERVDILAHPELKRKDSGLDHVIAKSAGEKRVAISIGMKQLLRNSGKKRSHILSHQRRNIKLCQKYNAPVVSSSCASSLHQMRGPRELASIAHILGMEMKDAFKTVSNVPSTILNRSDKKRSSDFIRPGVEKEE